MTSDRQTITLPEWAVRETPGLGLTEEDRRLIEEFAALPDERLIIEELRDRIRIRSTSWVGVVHLRNVEIQVIPKLAGSSLGVLEMIEQTSGLDALWRSSSVRDLDNQGGNLYDLFVLLLVEECERILRSGVLADYVEEEDTLPVLRGRLLFDRQLRQRYGQLDRLICRYDEHHQDITENQILAYALDHCGRRVRHPAIARRAHQVGAIFREVCDWTSLDLGLCWEGLAYHRLNEHYREAHDLARLVIQGAGVTSLCGRGSTECFAFLIDMNLLFERFVLRVLQAVVRPWDVQVRYQQAERSVVWDALENRPYRRVVPDFVLTQNLSGTKMLAVDAKYKLYDDSKVQPGDIYQAFIYAYAYEQPSELPHSILIYPSASVDGSVSHLQIRTVTRNPKAALSVVGINIPTLVQELKNTAVGPTIAGLGQILGKHLGRAYGSIPDALATTFQIVSA